MVTGTSSSGHSTLQQRGSTAIVTTSSTPTSVAVSPVGLVPSSSSPAAQTSTPTGSRFGGQQQHSQPQSQQPPQSASPRRSASILTATASVSTMVMLSRRFFLVWNVTSLKRLFFLLVMTLLIASVVYSRWLWLTIGGEGDVRVGGEGDVRVGGEGDVRVGGEGDVRVGGEGDVRVGTNDRRHHRHRSTTAEGVMDVDVVETPASVIQRLRSSGVCSIPRSMQQGQGKPATATRQHQQLPATEHISFMVNEEQVDDLPLGSRQPVPSSLPLVPTGTARVAPVPVSPPPLSFLRIACLGDSNTRGQPYAGPNDDYSQLIFRYVYSLLSVNVHHHQQEHVEQSSSSSVPGAADATVAAADEKEEEENEKEASSSVFSRFLSALRHQPVETMASTKSTGYWSHLFTFSSSPKKTDAAATVVDTVPSVVSPPLQLTYNRTAVMKQQQKKPKSNKGPVDSKQRRGQIYTSTSTASTTGKGKGEEINEVEGRQQRKVFPPPPFTAIEVANFGQGGATATEEGRIHRKGQSLLPYRTSPPAMTAARYILGDNNKNKDDEKADEKNKSAQKTPPPPPPPTTVPQIMTLMLGTNDGMTWKGADAYRAGIEGILRPYLSYTSHHHHSKKEEGGISTYTHHHQEKDKIKEEEVEQEEAEEKPKIIVLVVPGPSFKGPLDGPAANYTEGFLNSNHSIGSSGNNVENQQQHQQQKMETKDLLAEHLMPYSLIHREIRSVLASLVVDYNERVRPKYHHQFHSTSTVNSSSTTPSGKSAAAATSAGTATNTAATTSTTTSPPPSSSYRQVLLLADVFSPLMRVLQDHYQKKQQQKHDDVAQTQKEEEDGEKEKDEDGVKEKKESSEKESEKAPSPPFHPFYRWDTDIKHLFFDPLHLSPPAHHVVANTIMATLCHSHSGDDDDVVVGDGDGDGDGDGVPLSSRKQLHAVEEELGVTLPLYRFQNL